MSTNEKKMVRRLRYGRAAMRLAAVLLIAAAVAGCGKKGSPQPPPDQPNYYPRVYPSE